MSIDTLQATEELLDTLIHLLDESNPDDLLPKILKSATQILHADASVLEIPGDETLLLFYPEKSPISLSAVKKAKGENRVILWNQLEDDDVDLSQSIVQNQLTSIMVAPFRTPQSESGYLYLQRKARTDSFSEQERLLFESFVTVCEKLAFTAYDRLREKESLDVLKGICRKGGIIYGSEPMVNLMALAEKLAALPLPVIIRGETGTGKELFARWLHSESPRRDMPFVAINCGAIPENLIESILFGHVKGSFTGAIENRKGVFEQAEGGAVFLDEIGELPLSMQVKLLRVLQEKHITRVGDNREIPVNVRVISATHVDLEEAVKEKKFREDLYFRIQVMPVEIPPLRNRGQDVILLAESFLEKYCAEYGRGRFRLSRASEKALLSYSWPGNVRELENKIQKSLIQAVRGVISPEDLGLENVSEQVKNSPRTLREARESAEKTVIHQALLDSKGNLTLAATILGIDRKVLREVMERLKIRKEEYKN
ncbi:MAG TPA: sigma-54 dependent transcriptional regulator [Fibrobacteraceae bacterium]|jgi:transcriptional regulator with GAF, ATPase, and Fis domain|nr:sigma-54-dependent Fis family transcriptional regulator [Fibrobacter sp.]HPW94235.1 sigma-54 dependent transcriptional regulator [Fibrobacteraceae bacterium]